LAPGGNAFALGQQWRPAPGFVPAQVRPYPGVANIPSFRPRTVARTRYDQRFTPVERRQPRASLPHYQTPYRGMPHAAGPFQAHYLGATPAFPGWVQPFPFGGVAHAWQQQVPMFAPQFAGRPVEPRYGARPAPRMVGIPPSRTGYAPRFGSWRPAAAPMDLGRQPLAHQPSLSGPSRRTILHSKASAAWPGVAAAQAGRASLAAEYARAHWRPDSSTRTTAWHARNAFRPVTYGRNGNAADDRIAARGGAGVDAPREGLPGWATTYRDTGHVDTCGWCNGS
jgi:hypothetical protein